MKRVILFLGVLALAVVSSTYAQNRKFGHINTQQLIASMPEQDSATVKLNAFEKELSEQMDQLRVEFNKKYQDYLQKKNSLSPALLETREKELQDLQQRLQEFQAAAQRDFQDMQGKLMKPIIEKAKAAIQKVGRANGFFYIFDQSLNVLPYISPESIDVLPLVQKELGIKPKSVNKK